MRPIDRLIVALDLPTIDLTIGQVDHLGDAVERYKVGLELFSAVGPQAVTALTQRGKRVFLDLKLHDIPETVYRAASVAAQLDVDLLTVHASGGAEMLRRAVKGARGGRTKVLAVTVLTSLDESDLARDGNPLPLSHLVVRRAQIAQEAGCDGVIASAQEVEAIRQSLPRPFLVVTPGIRPSGQAVADQKRVATPAEARRAGADAIVVGRPIRDAKDPRAVVAQLVAELV